jgi:acetyl esterase/lipase
MISRDISYGKLSKQKNLLDVVHDPAKKNLQVIFFIHGGGWMSGSKDMYTRLGEHFLTKGFVSVIISYRLFPEVSVFDMADDCAAAFQWCKNNIGEYGGDAQRIFLSGHSAGGHLAALTGLLEKNPRNALSGFILIDAFGLCAHHFLCHHQHMIPEFLADIFGKEEKRWSQVSPDKLLRKNLPPFLVLTGAATYPFLSYDNSHFVSLLRKNEVACEHKILPFKSHMQMIYDFDNAQSPVYDLVLQWMKNL